MKTKFEFPALITGILVFAAISFIPASAYPQYEEVSLETFYEELSPYGVWINDPEYGRVWRPDVDQEEFRPYYTRGHWEMTKYGNTWVSDYEWGWAPFHYGRWHHSGRRGWVWIPDVHWGPAWVSWRSGGGYYGWAPLGPGININISIGRIPALYWVFVPQRSIYHRNYPGYDYRRNTHIYNRTVIINNTYVYNNKKYYTGPRASEIRRVTGKPVRINTVRDYRSERYAKRNEHNTPSRSASRVQAPRPQRAAGNADRPIVSQRQGSSATPRSQGQVAGRTTGQKIPASSQRSARTYDNHETRNGQAVRTQRERVSERTPAQRTQRPASAPQRVERTQRPVQREAVRQGSRQESRGNSQAKGPQRSSSQQRPARVQ
jgi:hypothetical protein